MDTQNIMREIDLTRLEMHRMNVNSPHYKDLKRKIKNLERKLNHEAKNY